MPNVLHVSPAGDVQHEDSDCEEWDLYLSDGGQHGDPLLHDRQAVVLLPVEQSQPGAVLCYSV